MGNRALTHLRPIFPLSDPLDACRWPSRFSWRNYGLGPGIRLSAAAQPDSKWPHSTQASKTFEASQVSGVLECVVSFGFAISQSRNGELSWNCRRKMEGEQHAV